MNDSLDKIVAALNTLSEQNAKIAQTLERISSILVDQNTHALGFSKEMFCAVAGGISGPFIAKMHEEQQAQIKRLSENTEISDAERLEAFNRFNTEITNGTHQMIQRHVSMIAGGLTKMMFPGLFPPDSEPAVLEQPLVTQVPEAPEPIVVGLKGIEAPE
jgi:hypothetical protein